MLRSQNTVAFPSVPTISAKIFKSQVRIDEWLLALFVTLLPCMWPIGIWLLGSYVYVADAVFIAACTVWLARILLGQVKVRMGWFYLPITVYLAATMASAFASIDLHASLRKLLLDIYLLTVCAVTYNVVRTPRMLRMVLIAWALGTAITATASIAGAVLFYVGVRHETNPLIRGFGSLPPGNYARFSGLFLNFNMACNYLSIGLLIVLAIRRIRWVRTPLFCLLVVMIIVSATLTVSPGLGGLVLGFCLWLWADWRKERRFRAKLALFGGCAGALAMCIATVISPTQLAQEGIATAIARHDLQPSSRMLCWEAAVSTLRQYPLLGKGTGLPIECPPYRRADGEVESLLDAHNSYLNIAALKGIFGLAGFLTIAGWLLTRTGHWSLASTYDVIVTTLAIAFAQGFLYQGLSGSFEHTRHLWVLAGLLMAAIEIRHSNIHSGITGAAPHPNPGG
jgi:O-antigen ligase